ncbi:hypothetical protein KPL37_14180 [Clostridium frigoris]|uniref:Uncharacterized protein n=1 Tax=Clostridium frigoris TaxID=205327 RepID=A0ABS6BWB4_9CLOT|nr:hypothetical protein [Clostridium frigoris]MBU3160890.1 hypothetical protein [Clostridium frigoris]
MSEMTLRLPSSYVDVESDEMEYIDGGYSLDKTKSMLYGAIGFGVSKLASQSISGTMIKAVMATAGGEVLFAFDTAVLAAISSPWTIPVLGAGLVAGIYSYGHFSLHKW